MHSSVNAVKPGSPSARIRQTVQAFPPVYFAMVMATGIVSIAVYLNGMQRLAATLLWLNVVLFIAFWILLIGRLALAPRGLLEELISFKLAPGFFTIVAGTSVLARQLLIIQADIRFPIAMFCFAFPVWASFIYLIFTAFTVKGDKPDLAHGIHGGWLLSVVATQSVGMLAALLANQLAAYRQQLLFLSLALWLCGGMLYIWIISLIFYRYTFFKFLPSDLMPPYWINMGAMAISTLVGAILIQSAPFAGFLQDMLPFLKGFTMLFWATATWWIPMLLTLGFWRHVYKRFPLRYDPLYWGAVFPLGMYSVSTKHLSLAFQLPFLDWLPRTFAYVALAAWLLTFMGFLAELRLRLMPKFTEIEANH